MTQLPVHSRLVEDRLRVVLFVGLLVLAGACAQSKSSPTATAGRLDLTAWDFGVDGDVTLVGTWEICWGQLLEPGQPCPSRWRPIPVRGLWTEEAAASPFGGQGVATYRLRISLPPGEERLSLLAGGPFTAHRLWIDGADRGGVGVVGRNARETTMGVRNRVYDVSLGPDDAEIELLVQVANFEFRTGGLRRFWFIGRPDSVQRGIGTAMLREGMVFSVGVVVGLVYLLLFALGPSERARGYFGLAALVLGLRAVPASISGFGALLAPWASFELLTRLEYLGTTIAIFAGAGYARTKVAGVVPPRVTELIQLVAAALAVITAFAPFSLVLAALPAQYVLPVLVMGLFIVCYGFAWYKGVPGVRVTAAASLIYLGVVVHDIVRSLKSGLGAPVELYPYAMVLWILAEGSELMQKFYQTFVRVESLSDELAEANFELQETESAIVRFVPFDFLKMLGKHSIRDVNAGDRVRSRISVLQCGFQKQGRDDAQASTERDFDYVQDIVARVEPLITHRGGFVNEFSGDGFQAYFPGSASAAVSSGVEISQAVRRFNIDTASRRRPAIRVGIGIDTGMVLLGTIGSREHVLRGVVGEAVEGAREIQRMAMGVDGQVLISTATREELGDVSDLEIRPYPGAGDDAGPEAIRMYEVRGTAKGEVG